MCYIDTHILSISTYLGFGFVYTDLGFEFASHKSISSIYIGMDEDSKYHMLSTLNYFQPSQYYAI